MRRSKKICAIFLVNIVVFAIIFLIVEVAFRFAKFPFKADRIPPEHVVGKFDDELGWSYIPNKSASFEFNGKTIHMFFDKDGIRIPSPDFEFDYSKPSILFVGCSFTMGHALNFEESFVGKFAEVDKMPYQVVNLGVQGYGSDQSLIALRKFLLKFNTKVVVYTFISSHITRNGNYDRRLIWPASKYLGTKPLFGLNKRKELYLSKKPVLFENYTNSYLIDFLKIRLGKMLGVFPPRPKELSKVIIQKMKTYSEDHGAHFVSINWRWKKKKYNYEDLFESVNTISTIENPPLGWENMRIPNDNHPDEHACNYVANLIRKYFINNNLL